MPTVNERCKILRSLNRVYVFEIVLLLVPRLKILRGFSTGSGWNGSFAGESVFSISPRSSA